MKKDHFFYLYIGAAGMAAFILMLWLTPYGAGTSPDSTVYIGGAKSLLLGNGFSINSEPITHYPPLYSLLLAGFGILENNLIQAARFLNAFLFGINIGLIGLAAYFATGRNFLASACAMLTFLSSEWFLLLHAMAYSEPLFITFSLACIIFLSSYIENPTPRLFIASSLSLGLALITRYIGIAFLPAALIIIFISKDSRNISQKLRSSFAWLALSCMPLGISLAINMMTSKSATNRSFVFHLMPISNYLKGVGAVIFDLITPTSFTNETKSAILWTLIFALIAALAFFLKGRAKDITWHSMSVATAISCFLFSFSYLLFLYISISFFDAGTPVNARLLTPIFTALTIGTFSLAWNTSQILDKPALWWGFIFVAAVSIAIKAPETINVAENIQKNGLGYTSQQWQSSESIAFIRKLEVDAEIYTNGSDVISLLTDKQSQMIPRKIFSATTNANPNYATETETMCKNITAGKAILVYFNRINRPYLPNQTELEADCGLSILQNFTDGTVYGKK